MNELKMKKNLIDTLSLMALLAGLSLALALIVKFPVIGFAIFLFIVMYCIVAFVNAVDDRITK